MAEFGTVVLGMLIFSERTWKHHAVTLLIPFAVIAHQMFAFRLPRGLWWYLAGTIAAVVVLMLLTASGVVTLFGVPDSDDLFGKYVQAYGAYLWSFVLLLIAMFTLSGRKVDYPPSEIATQAARPHFRIRPLRHKRPERKVSKFRFPPSTSRKPWPTCPEWPASLQKFGHLGIGRNS